MKLTIDWRRRFNAPTVNWKQNIHKLYLGKILSAQRVGLVALLLSVGFFAMVLHSLLTPSPVYAYGVTLDIQPTWDISTSQQQLWQEGNPCAVDQTTYQAEPVSQTTLPIGRDLADPTDCSLISNYTTSNHRIAIKYSLAAIPENAAITSASLVVTVSNTTTQAVSVVHTTSDEVDTLATNDATLYNAIGGGQWYGSGFFTGTGLVTIPFALGSLTDIDVRMRTTDSIGIGLYSTETGSNDGAIDSLEHGTASNRPVLRITYTLPPPAPTTFSLVSRTTTALSWSWNDAATTETRYDVHSASHTAVAGCSNLPANSLNCTETGLSANTLYTRHAAVTDGDGTSDSATVSVYTAIEPISVVTQSASTTTSCTVRVDGVSNLGSGQAAVYFEDLTSGRNSGWITSTSWTEDGLVSGTTHNIRAKSRNGDGIETVFSNSISATTAVETIATPPESAPTHSTVSTPQITNFSNGDRTADTTPTIAGTGPAGATMFIVVDRRLVRTVLVGSNGKFFVDLLSPLHLGNHQVAVRAKTISGEVSDESEPITITVESPGGGTTITSRTVTNGESPTVQFRAVAPRNSVVFVVLDGEIIQTINATTSRPAFGFITTVEPPTSLLAGRHTISFVTRTSSGHLSVPTGTTTFQKIVSQALVPAVSFRYDQPTLYTVQRGDSLWTIAQQFLGNGNRWPEVQSVNAVSYPSILQNPRKIFTTWTLAIPVG